MKNSDELAYPHTERDTYQGEEITNNHFGLTKREAFAMAAMQGILSHSFGRGDAEDLAIASINSADALLAELEK